MGSESHRQMNEVGGGNKGCLKFACFFFLMGAMLYFGFHLYFLWQPADRSDAFSERVMSAHVAGKKIFPAIQTYPLERIAGRAEILRGEAVEQSLPIKERLANAIEGDYPISFREDEINAWLAGRLQVKQGGALARYVEIRGVWVNFRQDEIELIIERGLPKGNTHVTSLFMEFERNKDGYTVSRHACHVGQVRLPGGFVRLLMPAYENLRGELAAELKPYDERKIFDVRVEDGKITLDPRRFREMP